MGVREKKKDKPYKASDKQTYPVTKMVNVTTNRVGEVTDSVNYGGGGVEVTGYKKKRGKSAKAARQEHRATKKKSKQRKKEHRKARKKK